MAGSQHASQDGMGPRAPRCAVAPRRLASDQPTVKLTTPVRVADHVEPVRATLRKETITSYRNHKPSPGTTSWSP